MPKKAIWRDASKTTATGLYIPEHRLKLPFGEAVLRLPLGFVVDEKNLEQKTFTVHCTAIGMTLAETTKETDAEKAKQAAILILRKYLQATIAAYREDLEALDTVVARAKKADAPAQNVTETAKAEKADTETPTEKTPPKPRKRTEKAPEKAAKEKTKSRKMAEKPVADADAKPAPKMRSKKPKTTTKK